MDIATVMTGVGGVGGIGASLLYFIPKLRKYKAETDSTTVDTLEKALQSLQFIYEQKLDVVQSVYKIQIGGIRKQHDLLQIEVDKLRKRLTENDNLYQLDRETLVKIRKAVKEGESCSIFATCPMKIKFKELGGKL